MSKGYDFYSLWQEFQLVDNTWKEGIANYWSRFIHDVKQKGFNVVINNKARCLDILKENRKIMSLYYIKEMLDEEIRYSLELVDRFLFEEIEVGKKINYNGKVWTIKYIKGDWIRIQCGSYEKTINRKVLEKQNIEEETIKDILSFIKSLMSKNKNTSFIKKETKKKFNISDIEVERALQLLEENL